MMLLQRLHRSYHRIVKLAGVRFLCIGAINTLVDVSLFQLLYSIVGLPLIIANCISTTIALALSYVLNSKYTFAQKRSRRTVLLFMAVTLTGLWLLQPAVIHLLLPLIHGIAPGLNSHGAVVLAKIMSIGATLIWNFVLYKKLVFRKRNIDM